MKNLYTENQSEELDKLRVYLVQSRYMQPNPTNAQEFLKARKLKENIEKYMQDVEADLFEKYSIPLIDFGNPFEFDFEFEDKYAVRYLFFPQRNTKYSEVYNQIHSRETVKISSSTGDLDIIDEMQKMRSYSFKGFEVVSNEKNVYITKEIKDIGQVRREYLVLRVDDNNFIRINDILLNLNQLKGLYSSIKTQLKVDFFTAPQV